MSTMQATPASLSLSVQAAVRQDLQRIGVSPSGADQIVKGQIVINPTDRSRIAQLLAAASQRKNMCLYDLLISS